MKRLLTLILAALVAAAVPLSAQQDPVETLRVDVRLVNVFTTVTDRTGRPVASLAKADFELLEDGRPQTISVFGRESELPLSIVLAVDASLSTRKDLKLELEAARRFARTTVRPVDALSVFQFTEHVDQILSFTHDLRRIDRALDRVEIGAGTAVYDALSLAADVLLDRQGRKVILIISDGGDTMSKGTYHQAVRAAQEAEAIVYSIIVVPVAAQAGRNTGGENALIQISKDTGGKHYYSAGKDQLDDAFRQISEELRTQYLLAYYPDRKRSDSGFRRIEVKVKQPAAAPNAANGESQLADPAYLVRHRTGYYTARPR